MAAYGSLGPEDDGRLDPQLGGAPAWGVALLQRLEQLERENQMLAQQLDQQKQQQQQQQHSDLDAVSESAIEQRVASKVAQRLRDVEQRLAREGARLDGLQEVVLPLQQVVRVTEGAALRGGALDGELQNLRLELGAVREEAVAHREREKQKSALVFGELVRVNGAVAAAADGQAAEALGQGEHVVELRARCEALEHALGRAHAREGEAAAGAAAQGGQLGAVVEALQRQVGNLAAEAAGGAAARDAASAAHAEWASRLQATLGHVDSAMGERLASALQQMGQQLVYDRAEASSRLEHAAAQAAQAERARQEEHGASKRVLGARLDALEAAAEHERARRDADAAAAARAGTESAQEGRGLLAEEAAARKGAQQKLVLELEAGLSNAKASIENASESLTARVDQLEEVLRAEVGARLKTEGALRESAEVARASMGKALAVLQAEAKEQAAGLAASLRTQDRSLTARVEASVGGVQKEMGEQARAQRVLHGELRAKLTLLEAAEQHQDEARDAVQGELGRRLEEYRGGVDEMVDALSRRLSAQREVIDATIAQARAATAAEVREAEGRGGAALAKAERALAKEVGAVGGAAAAAAAGLRAAVDGERARAAAAEAAAAARADGAAVAAQVGAALGAAVDRVADEAAAAADASAAAALLDVDEAWRATAEEAAAREAGAHAAVAAAAESGTATALRAAAALTETVDNLSQALEEQHEALRRDRDADLQEARDRGAALRLAQDGGAEALCEVQAAVAAGAALGAAVASVAEGAAAAERAELRTELLGARREQQLSFDALQSAAATERAYAKDLRARIEGVGAAVEELRAQRTLAREQNMKLALAIQSDQAAVAAAAAAAAAATTAAPPRVPAGGGAAAAAALGVSAPRVVPAVRDVFGL